MTKVVCVQAVALIATIVSGSGCRAGCERSCPKTEVTARALAGSITFTIGDAPAEMHSLPPSDRVVNRNTVASGMCAMGSFATVVYPDNNQPTSKGDADVMCARSDGQLGLAVNMPDVRSLDVGTYQRSSDSLVLFFQNDQCGTGKSDGTATLVVTRAEGASAPYPAGVTSDYVREFNLHVEAQAAPGSYPVSCTTLPSASATVDLQYAGTAADAVNDPAATCACAL